MSRVKAITLAIILFGIISTALVWAEYVSNTASESTSKSEVLTLALRSAGDELLHAAENDTARVLPLGQSGDWFILQFESKLSIEPDRLVEVLNSSMKALNVPTNYWAEVKIGKSDSVVYSYLMDGDLNSSIIPCFGRSLPLDEYTVNVKVAAQESPGPTLILGGAVILVFLVVFSARTFQAPAARDPAIGIGNYRLKKRERKLSFKNQDMRLTEKEVELLELFSSRPNETISREELQYEVWESKGVVVGRSLDTYISKLRKKLDKDKSVLIKNVHGAGYKLEVGK